MKLFQDMPATYHICVYGGLESSWAERLWGMTSTPIKEAGDQADLVGIINALYNLGHTVVSVERFAPDEDPCLNDTEKEA